jgi:hypothetical protein
MARPITHWSFSSLSMFENCNLKYQQVKVLKNFDDSNQYNRQGDDEHGSIENFLKANQPLIAKVSGLTPILQTIRDAPGENRVEMKMAITNEFIPCRGNDWNNAWCRANADFVKLNLPRATYFDWKSGKARDTEDQIELTSLLLFAHFPDLQRVDGAMYYYRFNKMAPHTVYRSDIQRLWNGYISRVRVLENAIQNNVWPANPNPLCGWCPVITCQHNTVAERLKREAAKAQGG